MEKFEIVEFNAGADIRYAIRRTSGIFKKTIQFFDLRSGVLRKQHCRDSDCFSPDLNNVTYIFMKWGFAEGKPLNTKSVIKLNEITAMNSLAETDEGMKDLLLRAKEYFCLKKK